MVELRKRPPPKETATPAPAAKRGGAIKKLAEKAKNAISSKGAGGQKKAAAAPVPAAPAPEANGSAGKDAKIAVGDTIALDGFGGTVQTHDGTSVTFKELLDKSGNGVALFTYPRASTPGCTNQACLFRDNYDAITGASLSVFGLSTDSPKANTTFAVKQKLPYQLLCDPNATLTSAIGMKKPGPGKSTTRGVVVIDKQGIVRVWEQAGPAKTLDAVLEYIKTSGPTQTGETAVADAPPAEVPVVSVDEVKSDDPVAPENKLELADPDTKMDEVPLITTPSREEQEAATTAAEVGETAAKIDAAVGELKS
ncbi:hypothetical protein A1O3_09789 [Capronia epimyces CBS 606.96]|uniref:thioredoxin-dependent peroxiredoxin n=1 Tax=Capronia epimyces CBS 606.96 TaxID=1182542 RepID=W9XAQ7_9EURO|nr:uncharacterized protein A1O3_09789 [Capronia epimyces CBS 606.96]EXJ77562.1 hypothetical protein A1O3_09789 [Capronia epimyces CBS 606.96]